MPFYAGFDLGGTQLKYGLIDENLNIISQENVDTPEKITDLTALIKICWEKLKKEAGKPIETVGFGFPGIFSTCKQKILQSPNYPSIDNFDLLSALSEFIKVPFIVGNDANMAAFGEYKAGAGKGAHSMILLTIGTGVGGGVVLEGKLWQGSGGFAGEIGHVIVNPEGELCNCGSRGCLETEGSAPKIVKNYQELKPTKENLSAKDIAMRAKQGDKAATKAFARAGRFLGIGIGTAINLLNPEKVVLGGGVMKAGDLLLAPTINEARKRSFKGSFECCSIVPAVLGNKAGFLGSACWARERLIS